MIKNSVYIIDQIEKYLRSGKCTNKRIYRMLSNVESHEIVFGEQPYVAEVSFSGRGRVVGEKTNFEYSNALKYSVETTNTRTIDFDFAETNQVVLHKDNKAPSWVIEKYSKYYLPEAAQIAKMCRYAGKDHLPSGYKVKSCQVIRSNITYNKSYYADFCAVYIKKNGKQKLIGFLQNGYFTFDDDFTYNNTNFALITNIISYIILGIIVFGIIFGFVSAIINDTKDMGIINYLISCLGIFK